MLEQFFTWYKIDRKLKTENTMTISYLYSHQRFDDKYFDESIITSTREKFLLCCQKKNLRLNRTSLIKTFSRYFRGLKTFHSLSYSRGGKAISYWISVRNDSCPMKHRICFGEIMYYFVFDDEYYAFIKHYKCIDKCLSDGLSSITIPPNLLYRLNNFYHFLHDKEFSYKVISIESILNKVIRMSWNGSNTSVFTEVHLDWEHD